jgi:cellulose synthase/poly-beta-1,6-N-acetylglucosamine synthase-like glycosyltransferase
MQLLKNTTLFQFTKKTFKKWCRVNSFIFGRMFFLLFGGFVLAGYAVLIGFYYRQWKKLKDYTPTVPATVFVSVIIAARNEEKTLPLLIQDLYKQIYPSHLFEVIVVDDFSTDGTPFLASGWPPHFRMICPTATADESSKKKAIAAGVAQARGELILVTDADCRVGQAWVSTLASFYAETGASFIAAPVRYTYQPSPLQALQVLDFITLQGITAASVAADFGTMCNGANLAYTKKAFEAVQGFAGIDQVPTGDDMLLMYKIRQLDPSKLFYVKSRAAIVATAPMPNWTEFLQQRRRWASKTLVYDDKRLILVLAFVLLINLLPVVFFAMAIFQTKYLLYWICFLFGKALVEYPFVKSVSAFYGQQHLMRWFFFLQPLHVFYTVFVGIWSQVGGYEWKGRVAPG